jgi:ketosteroid isomerase-like protein
MLRFLAAVILVISATAVSAADNEDKINTILDTWHRAAATADEAVFFGLMADDAVYLGTDPGERWTKKQFMKWSKEHFEKDSAWSFEPYDRTVYFSGDGRVAWFEELLKSWMGVCRGSGVLVRGDGGWKIKHYNLAVTVPNDLIEDFIGMSDKKPDDSK